MATPTVNRMELTEACSDVATFQDVLRRLRLIDDRIISTLNSSLPTESFRAQRSLGQQCKEFSQELSRVHAERQKLIKNCINEASNSVATLRQQRELNSDASLTMNLRREQIKLRQMQSELNIEEIIRDRSLKVFYERCRLIYLPPDFCLS